MGGRTSQLQIRVSLEQKAALRRLAAAAGQNVSQYVLARALPEADGTLARAFDALRVGGNAREALHALGTALAGLDPLELETTLASSSVDGLSSTLQNRVAALVEDLAASRGFAPPPWASAVPPLTRPHFRWPLASLQPYQLRTALPAYKRRNLFDPHPPTVARRGPAGPEAGSSEMAALAEHLANIELDVEFYFIGGAVFSQVFPSRPKSGRPAHVFGWDRQESDPVAAFVATAGWPPTRLADLVRGIVGQGSPPGRFFETPHVAVFQPPAEYVLAVKLACSSGDPGAADMEDLRFLLRALNIVSESGARASISRYVADRHLPLGARRALSQLLGT